MTAEWRRGVSLAVVGLVIGLGLIGALATGTRAVRQGAAPEPAPQAEAVPAVRPADRAEARPAPAPAEPRFDVIRVEPDGAAVVAGRAEPNAEIELLVGGQPFARGRTDADGHFALVPPPFPAGSSEVTLRSTGGGGLAAAGSDSATVVVAADRRAPPLVAVSRAGQPTLVLSRPDETAPVAAAPAPLRVVSVDAEAGGRLHVSARGAPRTETRLYLNDTLVAPGRAGRDGRVSFTIGRGVRGGDYRVRIDQVDPASGTVQARSEVPFAYPKGLDGPVAAKSGPGATPEGRAPDATVRVAGAGEPGVVFVPGVGTAQVVRGDNLWSISRRVYGRGLRYTVIFGANQPQIRNPHRIYPGQVFVLPGDGGRDATMAPAEKRG
ncbi:LysM peptidoglycan-binding domain-containing protein [Methylobacterium oryzihabitans]|uniref:LysM peptidoglycan-binding domain-containing protein n=1 Tax=Methylobacterium oryzihabitans TaxID=2499852 RepID=A0A437NUW8_9HYPH|nr:LysM peptidoglycan-binding domain-containing protein [Methylobacterium oryzihabitans]RVU13810.1 LysM peptidoglycan-binding domain-containing protein [Methylobacterium oryzihabitans]